MRILETKVFQFGELSDSAKEKAREWYRRCQDGDNFYAESVYEDAAQIADLMGLDIRTRRVNLRGGGTRYDPCIYYRGFSSQGDGACFEGAWRAGDVKVGGVKDYASQDAELHRIAKEFEDIAKAFPNGYFKVAHSGHYYHEHCTSFDFELSPDLDDDAGRTNEASIEEAEEALKEAAKDFMRWIYKSLEQAWEWENADEQVDESIIANECEFEEDGTRA